MIRPLPSAETTAAAFSSPIPAGVWPAIRRHWLLALLPVIALTAAGVAYGLRRQPTYTAVAKLAVSKLELNAPGALAGFSVATESLAQTFSRSVSATGVVVPTARALHLTAAVVLGRLSAVPVPQTPVFGVEATGPSQSSAVALANTGASSLVSYLERVNSTAGQARDLLRQYQAVAASAERARSARSAAVGAYKSRSTAENLAAVQQASATLETREVHLQALFATYESAVENNPAPGLVQFLTPATTANSDRQSRLALSVLAGLVAGLLLGLALASARTFLGRRSA